MVEKVSKYFYKIPTVGLRTNEQMFFVRIVFPAVSNME